MRCCLIHLLVAATGMLSALPAVGAVVSVHRRVITYTETTPAGDELKFTFTFSMANDLLTFSSVELNGITVNSTADSDNIGPFLLTGGWVGGNHTIAGPGGDMRTATTESMQLSVDGRPVEPADLAGGMECTEFALEASNMIFMPASDIETFARETVTYTVAGNSIDVHVRHDYTCDKATYVDRYYGMQSMFYDETHVLTPGGVYATWTPVEEVGSFTRHSAPNFNTFVERCGNAFQASYLDPSTGLGDHAMVSPTDVVYIGNSSGKSYHKLIGARLVKAGEPTEWHGVYSWFSRPVEDGCGGTGPGVFAYSGFIGGREAIFRLEPDGTCGISYAGIDNVAADSRRGAFAYGGVRCITVTDAPDAVVYGITGMALHWGEGAFHCAPGIYLVSDGHGNLEKIRVR